MLLGIPEGHGRRPEAQRDPLWIAASTLRLAGRPRSVPSSCSKPGKSAAGHNHRRRYVVEDQGVTQGEANGAVAADPGRERWRATTRAKAVSRSPERQEKFLTTSGVEIQVVSYTHLTLPTIYSV